MKKCENCGKEHDGSYGSGRFCSKSCRMQWIGKTGHKTAIEKGTYKSNCSSIKIKSRKPFGTWKCPVCGEILETRRKLTDHKHQLHPTIYSKSKGKVWNKGLTKETDERVARHSLSLKEGYSSGRLVPHNLGKKHTEEEKHRISETMKRKIASGEIEVPYKRNHYSKGPSYPEQYFMDVFKNAGIKVEYNFQVGLYQLDFANPESKKYVEIDGDQHYLDKRIVQHDIERTNILAEKGWSLVSRVKWSEFQKLSHEEKEKICCELVDKLL